MAKRRETTGQAIRRLLQEQETTIDTFAERIGVHRSTVFRALADDERVRLDTYSAIARGLGVELQEIGVRA
jgi:transcriptional regulator with XRE-family HTH domain